MLSLTIREGEYVLIGDSVKVHFNRRKGKDLVLGVEAPKNIKITRSKVFTGELEKQAMEGNKEARELSTRIKDDHAELRRKITSRPA